MAQHHKLFAIICLKMIQEISCQFLIYLLGFDK